MLVELNISNVVLIDQLTIDFKQGLCVLTGETGAGKSVLLDSLGLALGVRAESGLVRTGAERASVTASFQIGLDHESIPILQGAGIDIEDDFLLLRRVVYASGKSRAFINDQAVSVSLLKQVGDCLVEIHGQFETQGLLNPSTHQTMLDLYAGLDLSDLSRCWDDWKSAEQTFHDLKLRSETAQEQEEYLRLSVSDLENLSPQKGEEEKLSSLRERLKNRDRVLEGLNEAHLFLTQEPDPVQAAWAALDKIAEHMDDNIRAALLALQTASSDLAEADALIQSSISDMHDEGANLEEIDDRLYALRMQARKHKCTVDDLPELLEEIRQNLDVITDSSAVLNQAKEEMNSARDEYIKQAEKISKMRHDVGARLNTLVQKELAPLKLEKAKFVTSIEPRDEVNWSENGMDKIQFLVATNPGGKPGPIHKIASGGEMSRFMLALKVIIAQEGSTHSFIFDEVDAGIGGATADAVGERLARLASSKQVLVVTHAPQVAARANHHWIVKKSGKMEVKTEITPLSDRQVRAEEIARMLAGADITDEARAAAHKLLDYAA